MNQVPLLTSTWKKVVAYDEARRRSGDTSQVGFVPVRTSVGLPRFGPPWTRAVPYVREVTPVGIYKLPPAEFWPAYNDRLTVAGVAKIQDEFDCIHQEYQVPLVLLCFEEDRATCHRGAFATWWEYQTGQVVPEATGLDERSIQRVLEESR